MTIKKIKKKSDHKNIESLKGDTSLKNLTSTKLSHKKTKEHNIYISNIIDYNRITNENTRPQRE